MSPENLSPLANWARARKYNGRRKPKLTGNRIPELFALQANLVGVHEELLAACAELSNPALAAFCCGTGKSSWQTDRTGQPPSEAAGQYYFARGRDASMISLYESELADK